MSSNKSKAKTSAGSSNSSGGGGSTGGGKMKKSNTISNANQSSPGVTKSSSKSPSSSSAASKLVSIMPFANSEQTITPKSSNKQSTSTSNSTSTSTRNRSDLVLPQTRVKLIMKTSPEIEFIGNDSLFLITKATELFIDYMASTAFTRSKSKSLQYKDLAELAQSDDNMDFLKDIIPRKIPARVALQEMARHKETLRQELLQ